MGDASLEAPDSQPFQDKQPADTSLGGSPKDTVGNGSASSIKTWDPTELSVLNSQRLEEDQAISDKDHAQIQAEADQSDVSGGNEKVFTDGNRQKSGEQNVNGDTSQDFCLSSQNLLECEQHIVDTHQEPANVLESESSSIISESLPRERCTDLNHDISMHLTDDSPAVINEHKVEFEIANEDGNHLPRSDSEKRDGLGEKFGSTDESNTGSTPPLSLSKEILQDPPFLPVSDSGQQQNQAPHQLVEDKEILPHSTSTGKGEVNVSFENEIDSFLDPSNQEWSDLDFGEATLVTADIEGWQRFDTEQAVTAQGADSGVRWEHLLDDAFNSIEEDDAIHPLQLALPPAYNESQPELASPGNPFIEDLARASSFSEEDSFVRSNGVRHTERPLQESSSHWREGLIDESVHDDPSSGMATSIEGAGNSVEPSAANQTKAKSHLQSSTSLDFMEPFEAPSFMSLVDPKSHALFEASMPTYQASHSASGHESGEEQWVANFDLVAPSTQEITRSISMPRPESDMAGQRAGQSASFTINRELESSKKENQSPSVSRSITGFLSPKINPLVQKVLDKVRSTPAAGNGVLNSVRQAMSPKASDKKSTSESSLTRCMCW